MFKKNQSKTKNKQKSVKSTSINIKEFAAGKIGPQPRAEPIVLDLHSLVNGDIKLAKVLKGEQNKISCLLDIDQVEYVVKASSPYLEDHITNTNIFHKLALPGVQAPSVVKLTDEFVTKLVQVSKLNPDPGAQDLITALKSGNNQLATKAPGFTIQDIQTSERELPLLVLNLFDLLETLVPPDAMKKLGTPGNDQWQTMKAQVLKAKTQNRQAAIDAFKKLTNNPSNLLRLSVLSIVAQGPEAVQERKSQIADMAVAKTALLKRAATAEGAYALGSLCVVDLLCGMDDRILAKWNGGNFIFDAKTDDLWCIDNAKNAERGLSSGNENRWKDFVATLGALSGKEQVPEQIYFFLYDSVDVPGEGFSGLIPDKSKPAIQGAIGKAVEETLAKFHELLKDGSVDKAVRDRLQARLNILEGTPEEVILEPSQPTISNKTGGFSVTRPSPTNITSPRQLNILSSPRPSPKIAAKETESPDTTSSSSESPEIISSPSKSPKIIISPNPSPIIISSSQSPNIISPSSQSPTIITSPRPTATAVQGLVRRPAFTRQVVEHFDPQTISVAQEIWGPQPLPSDPVSQSKIVAAVAWLDSHPTAGHLDFIRRLSVQLGINHPDLPETKTQ